MKNKIQIRLLFLLAVLLAHSMIYAENTISKDNLTKKLELIEGHYQTLFSKSTFCDEKYCQDEELDIQILQDEQGSLTLVIGTILSFPHLDKKEVVETENLDCANTYTNKIVNHHFEQKVKQKCGKSLDEKTHLLEFSKGEVDYTFLQSGAKQTCKYSLLTAKGNKK